MFLGLHCIRQGMWVALQRGIRLLLIILLQEIGEFRKLLKYLNEDLSPIICILLIINISFSASGIVWLLRFDAVDTATEPINGVSVLNTLLWVLIVVAPFIQVSYFVTLISRQKWIWEISKWKKYNVYDSNKDTMVSRHLTLWLCSCKLLTKYTRRVQKQTELFK